MKAVLLKIILGASVAYIVYVLLKHFGASEFNQGLYAGGVGVVIQNLIGNTLRRKGSRI